MDPATMSAFLELRKAIRPPQWEYESVSYGGEGDFQKLNELGRHGWEAVGVVPARETLMVLLKRPVDANRERQAALRKTRESRT